MVLDTGAQRSLVTPEAVARLDLERDDGAASSSRGIGGIERNRNALPRSFSLGGVALVRRTVNRDTSLTVGTLGSGVAGGGRVDGMLGRDFLSVFDLELDLRARSVTLHKVVDCARVVPPWVGGVSVIPVQMPADTALQVAVEVDGVRLRALLDTGASRSVITAPGMARLGLDEALLAQDPAMTMSGLGPRQVAARMHRFASLRVGDVVAEQPRLVVTPIRVVPIVEMLLGADFLADRLVWISFAGSALFISRR
jgi:predicted aspartyl protease